MVQNTRPTQVGGLLLRMTRGTDGETNGAAAKRREIGRDAAVLVYMSATKNLAKRGNPVPDLCYSIDVQHGEAHQAPKNYLAVAENVSAVCPHDSNLVEFCESAPFRMIG